MIDEDDAKSTSDGASDEPSSAEDASILSDTQARRSSLNKAFGLDEMVQGPLPKGDLVRFASMIERDVLPSVLAKHKLEDKNAPIYDPDVTEIIRLVLEGKIDMARGYLARLREQGAGIEDIFLHVLMTAAERLGVLWEDDRIDFWSVTDGTGQLITLMRGLAAGYSRFQHSDNRSTDPSYVSKRVLIVTLKGEDHSFGALMLAEFFRFAGWVVDTKVAVDEDDLCHTLASDYFDVLAVSVSVKRSIITLRSQVESMRKASRNRELLIGVGGSLLAELPEAAKQIGADFSSKSARHAVDQATRKLTLIRARQSDGKRAGVGKV